MSWLRRAVFALFVLYLVVVTWPVAVLFGSAEPFVLGIPFSLAWPILWIVLGGLALGVLDHFESRSRLDPPPPANAPRPPGTA